MKKDLVATISSSMRFYLDEVRRLGVLNCPIFSNIYEPAMEPINFAPMTEEEKKEQYERLMEDHKEKIRKSDYLIVLNKDGYIGEAVREEIRYAREIGVGILYSEYNLETYQDCIGEIRWNDNTYFLVHSTLRYMEDGLTECPDFHLSSALKKIKLAAVCDIPNVNKVQYSKEAMMNAMKDDRMKELFPIGLMQVEYGNSKDKCESPRVNIIDPQMVVGNVVVLGSHYLIIKPNEKFSEVFADCKDENLVAYMRYMGEVHKREDSDIRDVTNIRIITWDIWYNELPTSYLKTIS